MYISKWLLALIGLLFIGLATYTFLLVTDRPVSLIRVILVRY